jgi:CRISPR-associated endonuclease/helicase Cas3
MWRGAVGNGRSKADAFELQFAALTGFSPLRWQERLFHQHFITGNLPSALDVPTGLGKTSVMAIWLIAQARGAESPRIPRRLIYVVDRRAVVDQATDEAEKLRKALAGEAEHFERLEESSRAQAKKTAAELNDRLGFNGKRRLPISTLRGAHVDNREWLDDPRAPAIVVGTVDMIGSRLLFEGYGVSRKMRPYQAGLLGIDALIVLDESHLVLPFTHLLRAIEQDPLLRPNDAADRAVLPRFEFLPLSATQHEAARGEHGRLPFRLEEGDWKDDEVAKKRLDAKKRLHFEPLAGNPDRQLAEAALELATRDGRRRRVVVFCDRRDKNSDGPSAQGVKDAITSLANGDRKTGRARIEIYPPELLVGARRIRERSLVEDSLRNLGFIGKKDLEMPAFLIATSAGEVGVDVDADHMVCDLVAWERMVQRLGRVNRRGDGDAEVRVFWSKPAVKDADALTEAEKRALTAFLSKDVIEKLPPIDGAFDASPGSLRQLGERARSDAALKELIEAATTPEPLRPALNRALVDAWSMTSLETHTGRPDVAPWLRGWVEETPQTTLVWRTHLPVREGVSGWPRTKADKKEIEDFFEAAPLHESEKLETETFRVASLLQERCSALLYDTEEPAEQTPPQPRKLGRDEIVALIMSPNGAYSGRLALGDSAQERKGKAAKVEFRDEFVGKILVIDARLGGLKDGLLDSTNDDLPYTADTLIEWSKEACFRVQRCVDPSGADPEWRFEDRFVLSYDDEATPQEWLIVEHLRDAAQKEDSRSISRPQTLIEHQRWARREMQRISVAVGLPDAAVNAFLIGAALHDEGKKAPRWQRAFNAGRSGLIGPLAKTLGPIDQAILGGYRHEFGSLPVLEENAEFKALPGDWQDLVLHLVAAHHGRARPLIETRGCDDGPPSLLEERARAVALSFARLQKRWGPWGLAWWEALMRAADQQASRDNEGGQTVSARESA